MPTDIVENAKSEDDLIYRIRSKSQYIIEQGEMLVEFCDQLKICIINPSDSKKFDNLKELCRTLNEITEKNRILLKELQDDLEELQKRCR